MENRWRWETHHGVEILIHDYSNLRAEEVLEVLLINTTKIEELGRDQLRLLVNVRGSMANKELISTWKKIATENKHRYAKIAVVGLTGLLSTFLWGINRVSGIGARPFDDEDTAFKWLAED